MSVEDRGLPASEEAERAVLGAILLDNSAFFQTASLKPADFALDSHRRIFNRMVDMVRSEIPIDFVTITEKLGQHKEVESVGGVAYVTSLTDGLPRVKNISQYVTIVKDKSMLRQLIHASNSTLQRAYDMDEAAGQTVAHAQNALMGIVNERYTEASLDDVSRSTISRLMELRLRTGECIGFQCGQPDVDVLTTGFREKEVAIIGARPGNGKSAFMCQGIRKNVMKGAKVGCFSSELPKEEIFLRLACLETGIHVFDTRDPRVLREDDFNRLLEAIAFIPAEWEGKFFIDDTPCIEIDQLCARSRAWASKGVELVYTDHLHLVDGMATWQREQDKVMNSISRLWHLARSTGQAHVVLCQLKRIAQNTRPTMEDLRASGAIEQFAQLILLLYRELQFDEETGEVPVGSTGNDEIIISKQRSGPAHIAIESTFEKEVGRWVQRSGRLAKPVN